jgi:hypothetical protein
MMDWGGDDRTLRPQATQCDRSQEMPGVMRKERALKNSQATALTGFIIGEYPIFG